MLCFGSKELYYFTQITHSNFNYLYYTITQLVMKKTLLTTLNANLRLSQLWGNFLMICVLFLFASQVTYAQRVPVACTGPGPFTIISEDASSKTSNNAKMRISGALGGDDRVGYSVGTTYTGTSFAATAKLSTLTGGYISQTLPTPTATAGTNYTIRVYKSDTTCYYDKVFNLEYVNFNEAPKFPDIQVTSGVSGGTGGYFPLGSTANVSFTVQNAGDTTATDVKITLNIPAGLTLTGNTPPTGTTYDTATKEWTIGTIAKGELKTIVLNFTVGVRGLSFVSANTTTEVNIMVTDIPGIAPDKDSQPGNNATGEDDYGSVCISSPYDFCVGDEYKMTIASGNYTGIRWFKGSTELTSANATAEGVVWNGDGTITVKSEGIYRYEYPTSSCPAGGCCPIKVEAGVKPNLALIPDKTICLNGSFGTIGSTLSGYTGPTTLNPNGPVIYKWYNNNGTTNPTTTLLAAETGIALGALPTTVGVYKYKLVAFAQEHPNCKDSVLVTLTINDLPVPTLASDSPVCEQSPLTLTATPAGATSYAWTGPATFTNTAVQTFASAALSNGGTYMVTVTNGVGCSATATTSVIVNPKPAAPVTVAKEFCAGDPEATLTATALGGNFLLWYGNASTGGVGNTASTPINPSGAGATVYYVSQKVTATSCESNRSELLVTVHAKPVAPITAPVSACQNSPAITLNISESSTGYTVLWYGLNSTGGTGSTTKDIAPTNSVGTTSYYVSWKENTHNCESVRSTIPVEIRATPVVTLASNGPVCAESAINLVATPSGAANYSWSGPSGFTGSNIANPIVANSSTTNAGTYIVTVTNGTNCSASTSVVVVVKVLPNAPLVANRVLCQGDAAITLTAGLTGENILWYGGASTGGVSSTTAPIHNPTGASVTPYYATQIGDNQCESRRSELVVTVNAKPEKPVAENKTYCQGVAATALTVSGKPLHTFLWYGTSSTGGSTTQTPTPLTNATGTTTYYVSQKDNVTGCESDRDDAIVIVNRTPNAPTIADVRYCQDATATALSATAETGNTIIWYNGGATSTAAPTPNTTTAGLTYFYVSQAIPGTNCESGMSGIPVTIDPKPVATVIAVNSLCIGTVSQNNAKLILTRYRNSDEVTQYNTGTTITGPTLPIMVKPYSGGVFASNLPNPTTALQDYTVRIKNSFGCTIDARATLTKTDCGCPGGYCEPATVTKLK